VRPGFLRFVVRRRFFGEWRTLVPGRLFSGRLADLVRLFTVVALMLIASSCAAISRPARASRTHWSAVSIK
jgi:hypothetical protein